jgi:protein O-GlcNAc transferase
LIEQTLQQAMACQQRGELARAEGLYREVLARRPDDPACLGNLGKLLADQGRVAEGIACYEQALRAAPRVAALHYNLGMALRSRGQWAAAAAAYRRALELSPGLVQAYTNLGNVLQALGRADEAAEAYRAGLRRDPGDALAHNNLGNVFKATGRLDEALACYREALRLAPRFAEAWSNLADACFLTGRIDEALAHGEHAAELAPDHPLLRSNCIVWRMFQPGVDAGRTRQELRQWRVKFADPLKAEIRPHGNDRAPDRLLRVGYVSPNFRDHVVGRNIVPLFRHADRREFASFCYSDVLHADGLTEEFRRLAGTFREVSGMSDAALAEQIRADGIDILVDLTLHLADNRLLLFARKPAPVQVTFAGYPGSTGLDTIDYRLTDPYLDPPETVPDDAFYSEKSWRLPATFWCYDPLERDPPPAGPPPALSKGCVTFGCLNNFSKVNEGVLTLWARVLAGVPGSRLVLLADEGAHRERTLQKLENLGIARQRVSFLAKGPRKDYLQRYQQIDIGLDTLPYNGHTTSLDSYFMGVPVVTLVGQTVVGRAGLSQLTNLGMPELIGRTEGHYVHIACALASDPDRLAALRAALRLRMRNSPLMDAAAFARSIESAFRGMWRQWCAAADVSDIFVPVKNGSGPRPGIDRDQE